MAQNKDKPRPTLLQFPNEQPDEKYNTAFKQQGLKHIRIKVSAGSFAAMAFGIGILFIPTGGVLLYLSGQAQEIVLDYTKCMSPSSASCPVSNNTKRPLKCCMLNFTLTANLKKDAHIYYGLTNFYQNHRLFLKSKDDSQLYGGTDRPAEDCRPFDVDNNTNKPYWPCGALANAMFQDRFKLFINDMNASREINIHRSGIAWTSDITYKFKNPPNWNTTAFQNQNIPPPNWRILPWDLPGGLQNEDFVVWMRPSAFSDFRKLYGTVKKEYLVKGNYHWEIQHDFDVKAFRGTKSIVIATKTYIGGKNPVLGILYIAVGIFVLVCGLFFLYVHLTVPKL